MAARRDRSRGPPAGRPTAAGSQQDVRRPTAAGGREECDAEVTPPGRQYLWEIYLAQQGTTRRGRGGGATAAAAAQHGRYRSPPHNP
eukprot:gene3004-7074_t